MPDDHDERLIPSAKRLIESLRDTGYTYKAAFADIVDNSIAANSSLIHIDIDQEQYSNDLTICFYDNGCGMTEQSLINAMRYGSDERDDPNSLGKFGMGLKTASTAICRKFTVISKTKEDTGYSIKCWDIDEIKNTDKWRLLEPSTHDYASQIEKLEKVCGSESGTIVIWENIDRLIKNSGSDFREEALKEIIQELYNHLSATFGKFLDKNSDNPINILFNEKEIESWDPTCQFLNSKNPDRVISEEKPPQVVQVTSVDGKIVNGEYTIKGFILPRKSEMEDDELERVRFKNDNQGFYIYRENRLIFSGGWPHGIYSQDSHTNLLRVELCFDHVLDNYFEIDIRKSKINFPIKMREELKSILAPWRNEARRRYDGKDKKPIPNGTGKGGGKNVNHNPSSTLIGNTEGENAKVRIISFDKNSKKVIFENSFGQVEMNRAAIVDGTEIYVTTVNSIDGNMLWKYGISEEGKTILFLNENHKFYERFYRSKSIQPFMIQAMDSLLWSLANAENFSISDRSKENFEEHRLNVSNRLDHLAEELPDVEDYN